MAGQTELQGKVALITGGARGIGAAVAMELAGLGASVALVDLLEGQVGAKGVI